MTHHLIQRRPLPTAPILRHLNITDTPLHHLKMATAQHPSTTQPEPP
ncbi:hypothetical protein LZ757_02890 [Xylella fastidiosa subsp. morus]|uniref:Uncharacterized protein n=2 Tax=Xylella fastidiosa TaxID=2371 RepID=A0AAW6HQ13_XYLFS|nr:hypothetical protein [Xylella fastidiosa]KAJ4853320.1 hypothetical protein XYFPCFBP8418_003450 [Xylella fastidiosa subsp. multiplex]MBE0269353.1 hypothetical protein [Xylella fastidiosa subsp. multiplex]MBE0276024.1 hypothetical protein [Xylella fastidiosa subsp. multiplex]MBE0282616.1 hypothetical protein [Xylella fastidiosa subsp. multiplex]MDC6407231.1 hypothetical protein [Xylella fastidiosa subsp. multiplex]